MISVRHKFDSHIGAGEVAAARVLGRLFGVPERVAADWPEPGIYSQIALGGLLSEADRWDLSPLHARSSIDILLRTRDGRSVAVYVNGPDHNGPLKSRRDGVRYEMLRRNGLRVLVLPSIECPRLFKEGDGWEAEAEVRSMLHSYRVEVTPE